jgi:hypothetical protein
VVNKYYHGRATNNSYAIVLIMLVVPVLSVISLCVLFQQYIANTICYDTYYDLILTFRERTRGRHIFSNLFTLQGTVLFNAETKTR